MATIKHVPGDTAPAFEFETVPETVGANEYDPMVAALAAAPEDQGYRLTVPTDDLRKHLRRIQEAAHRIDRTARKVAGTEKVDGDTTSVLIRLRPKVTKNKDKDADTVDVAQESGE